MKKFKSIFKILIFVVIFVLVFSFLQNLFCRKTLNGAWNHTQKISGFYNEPQNEFDVIFFGSSNTYCSFNPLVMYNENGIKSYVFASQQQPVWASYAYMKEALKTQKPKLMVMDVLMFSKDDEYYDDGVNYSYMDDIPLSLNKIELALASAEKKEDCFGLVCNFVKYHSRWNELTQEDYTFKRSQTHDYLKGYVLLEDTFKETTPPKTDVVEEKPIGSKQMKYFEKIVKLAKDENVPLLLVKTPSNATQDEQKSFNFIKKLAESYGVEFVNYNFNYSQIGLDMQQDFYDKSHLNYKGAEKFTRFFANEIKDKTDVNKDESPNGNWDFAWEQYLEYCTNIENRNIIKG